MGAGRAYISGALTSAPDLADARALYERLGELCAAEGLVPYLPHSATDPELHPDVPPEEVYQRDVRLMTDSRLVVAYVGAASLGVGAELAIAAAHRLPIVAVRMPTDRVSRFALGLLRTADAVEVVAAPDELATEFRRGLRQALAGLRAEPRPAR